MPSKLVQSSRAEAGVLVATIMAPELRTPEVSYAVRDELISLATNGDTRHVVIDLGHVTFIGSIGLLGLLSLRRLESVSAIVVCNLPDAIKAMFLQCRLISEDADIEAPFGLARNVDEAMAAIADGENTEL